MRRHRVALITTTAAGFVAALAIAFTAPSQEASPSTSSALAASQTPSPIPPIPSDRDQMQAVRGQFMEYTRTAEANDEAALRALAAAEAAQEAASAAARRAAETRTAASTATTYQSTPSGSNSSIWACIIQHESGGNPTVYNHSGSGASGLYQFMPGTWNGYDGYANAADAPASVQTQYAYAYEAQNGWSAWVGDGCTPLG